MNTNLKDVRKSIVRRFCEDRISLESDASLISEIAMLIGALRDELNSLRRDGSLEVDTAEAEIEFFSAVGSVEHFADAVRRALLRQEGDLIHATRVISLVIFSHNLSPDSELQRTLKTCADGIFNEILGPRNYQSLLDHLATRKVVYTAGS